MTINPWRTSLRRIWKMEGREDKREGVRKDTYRKEKCEHNFDVWMFRNHELVSRCLGPRGIEVVSWHDICRRMKGKSDE